MKFIPGDEREGRLDCYEVGDSDILGIADERGDITAYVKRADGTHGHAYGGPVYDPPEFMNTCDRNRPGCTYCSDDNCPVRESIRRYWLTDAELVMATTLARKVGWL